jgi:Predicted membrane protein involved in D-alanine export
MFLLLGSAVANQWFAVRMHETEDPRKRKRILTWALVTNLGILAFFKYAKFLVNDVILEIARRFCLYTGQLDAYIDYNFGGKLDPFLVKIVLPVGISFFTFQALSYVIDIYRKKFAPAKTTLDFANYLSFFPVLVAGPIVRAPDLLPDMENLPRRDTVRIDIVRACALITIGLFKKMIIANWLAVNMVDLMFRDPSLYSSLDIMLGVYAYGLQVYCDFSAYSDIAIGAGMLFGFNFPTNFDAPFFTTSLRGFWRRWHISLSSWLKDYLYIPLGGSRKGAFRTNFNLFITFLLGGIWHGAGWTYILWGAGHGLYLAAERLFCGLLRLPKDYKAPKFLSVIAGVWLFHVLAISWVFFRSQHLSDVWSVFSGIYNWTSGTKFFTAQGVLVFVVAFLLQLLDGERLTALTTRVSAKLPGAAVGAIAALILSIIILGLAPQGIMPFIYFAF